MSQTFSANARDSQIHFITAHVYAIFGQDSLDFAKEFVKDASGEGFRNPFINTLTEPKNPFSMHVSPESSLGRRFVIEKIYNLTDMIETSAEASFTTNNIIEALKDWQSIKPDNDGFDSHKSIRLDITSNNIDVMSVKASIVSKAAKTSIPTSNTEQHGHAFKAGQIS